MESIRELFATLQIGIGITIIVFCIIIKKPRNNRKRFSIIAMTTCALILASADCLANTSTDMREIKIAKLLSYLMPLLVTGAFNQYVKEYISKESLLKAVDIVLTTGIMFLILSQFTNLYYQVTEDGYSRGRGYVISYLFPIVSLTMQIIGIVKNKTEIRKRMYYPIILFVILPETVSLIHIVNKGISLTSLMILVMDAFLFGSSLIDLDEQLIFANNQLERMLEQEKENAQQQEKTSKEQMKEICEAFGHIIETRDSYTQGHCVRVAEYARLIAQRAGKKEKECDEVYFAGLLHDIGKVGIPRNIINKNGRLNDDEFSIMKTHPEIGGGFLEDIKFSPALRIGARYHHERYDGRGYPCGLKGEEIPEVARIIAVADAYDAMSSKRSYHEVYTQEMVRKQIEDGIETQFDPKFGVIMLQIIDEDVDYKLRQETS